jgi:hypothetical protein
MSVVQVEALKKKLAYANKKVSYAWAKYYEEVYSHFSDATEEYKKLQVITTNDVIPEHIKTQIKEMGEELKKKWECCICLDFIKNIEVTNCGHFMCSDCLHKLKLSTKEPTWSCPVCRRKSDKGFAKE